MNKKLTIILDYQLGNLFSVKQACDKVGLSATVSFDKKDVAKADAIILPGVGAFAEAMSNLEKLDLVEPLKDFVAAGKPLFGICLGQQLLFTESEEFGNSKGLDLITGVIKKFPSYKEPNNLMKVPQVGWNHIYESANSWDGTPLQGIHKNAFMYFVHSYYVEPESSSNVLAHTNYEGIEYCSSVMRKPNIFATQFHPEKSGQIGVSIYKTWGKVNKLITNG